MSEPFHKVFKQHTDHDKWEKQIEFASLDDISEELRTDWIKSLTFLQEELGNGFLKSSNMNHPIHQKISNKATWQIQDLIDFSNTLQKLKVSDTNYLKLKEKLHSKKKCTQEGIPFVDIAHSYIQIGFNIRFLEEQKGKKSPDIEVLNPLNNDKLFIEVSKLSDSNERKSIEDNYRALFNKFHFQPPHFSFSCKQLEYITENEMPGVLNKIQEIKEKVKEEKSLIIYKDNKVDLAITHPSKQKELEEWCKINGDRRTDLSGLPLNFEESNRIVKNKKIVDKARQLPKEYPGLIYMPVNPLYLWVTSLDEAISIFEEQINLFPNLLGIVLYSYMCHTVEEERVVDNMHFYGRKMMNEDTSRDLFFVFNHKFKSSIKVDTLKKVYESFL